MPKRMMLSVQAKPDVSGIRTATLFNEEHTIIPCIALVEGVLWPANAPAPELALAEEFGRFPDGWNGRPVVYDHPKVNGEAVSASSPTVMEDVAFGQLFNTVITSKKLKTEIWINNDRVENMSDDVKDAVTRLTEGDETVEVSTGLFTMSEEASGEFDGEAFEAIWRNIVPDHLAVLPQGVKGACSVEDGCGAPRTNRMKPVMRAARMNTNVVTSDRTCECADPANCECEPKKGVFQRLMEAAGNLLQIRGNSENLSDNDTRTAIQGALASEEQWFWIMAVFDGGDGTGIFVYESFDANKLFEREFTIDASGEVTVGAEKTEVRPVTQFVPVAAMDDVTANSEVDAGTETQDGSIQENQMKDKDQLVNDLVANAATSFTEDDRAWLSTLEESQLAKMSPVDNQVAADLLTPDPEPEVVAPVIEEPAAPVSTEDYIASAPAEVQEVLNEGVRMHSARKDTLVKGILANARNLFTEPQLTAKSLTELESIASLATDVNFEGAGSLTRNTNTEDDTPPAPIPLFELNTSATA